MTNLREYIIENERLRAQVREQRQEIHRLRGELQAAIAAHDYLKLKQER